MIKYFCDCCKEELDILSAYNDQIFPITIGDLKLKVQVRFPEGLRIDFCRSCHDEIITAALKETYKKLKDGFIWSPRTQNWELPDDILKNIGLKRI